MPDNPPVMLFAAGLGTRMAPLTDAMPKPMLRVAGRPLVDHALDLVRRAGLRDVVANTHYLPDMLEPYLQNAGVRTVREAVLLETGGGVRNALPLLGGRPVVTLNTDAVWSGGNPVADLLAAWRPNEMDALLTLIHPESAIGHQGEGDFTIDAAGRLSRGPGLVYSGLQIMKTERLREIEDTVFSLNLLWDRMVEDGRLFGLQFKGGWCDVGRPDSIALAEAMLDV